MRIVNLRHGPPAPYVYCGRRMGGRKPVEASPLGNPFRLAGQSPADVKRCLEQYRAWLWAKVKANDPHVMALMNLITDESTLACYCVSLEGDAIFTEPERCHTQVIAKCWRYLRHAHRKTIAAPGPG